MGNSSFPEPAWLNKPKAQPAPNGRPATATDDELTTARVAQLPTAEQEHARELHDLRATVQALTDFLVESGYPAPRPLQSRIPAARAELGRASAPTVPKAPAPAKAPTPAASAHGPTESFLPPR